MFKGRIAFGGSLLLGVLACESEVSSFPSVQRLLPMGVGLADGRVFTSSFFDLATRTECFSIDPLRLRALDLPERGLCGPRIGQLSRQQELDAVSCGNFIRGLESADAPEVLLATTRRDDGLWMDDDDRLLRAGPPLASVPARLSANGWTCVDRDESEVILTAYAVEPATLPPDLPELRSEVSSRTDGLEVAGFVPEGGAFVPNSAYLGPAICTLALTSTDGPRCLPSAMFELPDEALGFDERCERRRTRFGSGFEGLIGSLDGLDAQPFRLLRSPSSIIYDRVDGACIPVERDEPGPSNAMETYELEFIDAQDLPALSVRGERLLSFSLPGEAIGLTGVAGSLYDQRLGTYCEPLDGLCWPSPWVARNQVRDGFRDPGCLESLGRITSPLFLRTWAYSMDRPAFVSIDLGAPSEAFGIRPLEGAAFIESGDRCIPYEDLQLGPAFVLEGAIDRNDLAPVDRAFLTSDGWVPVP